VIPVQPSNESPSETSPRHSPLGPSQKTGIYALLVGVVILLVGLFGSPWEGAWRSADDTETAAKDFVASRGGQPESYRVAHVMRYYPDGAWSERRDSSFFAVHPAFAYQFCLQRPGWDRWVLEMDSRARIVGLFHREMSGTAVRQMELDEARETACNEAGALLRMPLGAMVLRAESLATETHGNEYFFTYRWPEVLGTSHRLRLVVDGEHLSRMTVESISRTNLTNWPWGSVGEIWQRWIGGLLLLLVAGVVLIGYRGALAWRAAFYCGGAAFLLVLLDRLLRFPYYQIEAFFRPSGGNVFRSIGGASVEALQAGIILGLMVAIGEALARERLRGAATLTRLAPAQQGWAAAWMDAARGAFPWVLVVLVVEAISSAFGKPFGFMRVAAGQTAYALSLPTPILPVIVQTLFHAIWQEGIFRFGLLMAILFFVRNRTVAVILSAAAATLFGTSGPLSWHYAMWFVWAIIAGGIALKAGIRAAFLWHLMILGAETSLLLIWTGLIDAAWTGGIVVGLLLTGFFAIGVWAENARRVAS
jgi:hypothetical protein